MKWLDRKSVLLSMREHLAAIVIPIFALIIGIAAGATAYGQLQQFIRIDYIGGALQNLGTRAGFHLYGIVQTLCINIACFIMVTLPGIWMPGLPFSLIGVTLKGFFVGLAITAMLRFGGAFGVLGAILAVTLPGAPAAIVLVLAAYFGLCEWGPRSRSILQGGFSGAVSQPYIVNTLNLFKLFIVAVALDIALSGLLFSLCAALFA